MLVVVGLVVLAGRQPVEDPERESAGPTVTPSLSPQENLLTLNEVEYQYHYYRLQSDDRLELIPNFQEKKPAGEIIKEAGCDFAINAGFYTETDMPLGLFFAQDRLWSNFTQSPTFNGLLVVEKEDGIELVSAVEADDMVERIGGGEVFFAFQSGPLYDLTLAKQPNFFDKKYARRHLAAVDAGGGIWLFSVFEDGSLFNGPRLEDIPAFFVAEPISRLAEFIAVLNLDGGSASFYDDGVNTINEAKPVGALLCIR